jgi:hypothetical protein
MQDVGSKEDTGFRMEHLTLRLARVACRIRWTLSVCWKLDVFPPRVRGKRRTQVYSSPWKNTCQHGVGRLVGARFKSARPDDSRKTLRCNVGTAQCLFFSDRFSSGGGSATNSRYNSTS